MLGQLAAAADSRATRQFLNDLDDVDDVRFLLDEDVPTLNRLTRWYTNPDAHRHIDPDLSADDLVHVARNGDVSETRVVALDREGTPVWLEDGTSDYGYQHIIDRHVIGEQLSTSSNFFPVGGSIESSGTVYKIPNTMNSDEVLDLIYAGIRNGQRDPNDPGAILFNPADNGFSHTGIEEMRIVALSSEEGITTAYPTKGPSVIVVPGDS